MSLTKGTLYKSTKTGIEDGVRWSGKERQERGKRGG